MKNSIIGLKELRGNTENYISQVKKGKSFVVVRRSKPIFKITPIDDLGDEGVWETVADFTKFNKKGIPAKDLLKRLRDLNG
jgi:prevent-host-death family protein